MAMAETMEKEKETAEAESKKTAKAMVE